MLGHMPITGTLGRQNAPVSISSAPLPNFSATQPPPPLHSLSARHSSQKMSESRSVSVQVKVAGSQLNAPQSSSSLSGRQAWQTLSSQ